MARWYTTSAGRTVVGSKTVRDYFVAVLGMPDPPDRIEELGEDYPLTSEVGEQCRECIDAAGVVGRHIVAAYGSGQELEAVKQAVLQVCEVYAFG